MRRRPSRLVAVAAAVLTLTSCEARSYGTAPPVSPEAPQLTVVAPQGPLAPLPEAAPDEPVSGFNGLENRVMQATADAAAKGADLTTVVLDRSTGRRVTNGNGRGIAIASVVKLFIADDLLLRSPQLSADDQKMFESMLRNSDDSAAEVFWNRGGGGAVITRVAARYGLGGTRPPGNGRWFNTISTADDLVRYYEMMLSGAGGLPKDKAEMIVDNLAHSAAVGPDDARGQVHPVRADATHPALLHSDGLGVEPLWDAESLWVHAAGHHAVDADRRYVMAIGSDQPTSDGGARATITQAVKTMFPGGRI
ncbi:hypothetical protein A5662_09525 [Mycobacteriaceae bacterium 1482268.1]|nr:hypothetical protein A5662_09525 [Mycobacteriaceae bacterium 1482268.1]